MSKNPARIDATLPVPFVAEVQDYDNDGLVDWLDPDTVYPATHVTIDYPDMARDDLVTLIMEGAGASGAPVKFTYPQPPVGTPGPINWAVHQDDIWNFLDGQMDVYYIVSSNGRALESARLTLVVRRPGSMEPLPAAMVKDDKGNLVAEGGTVDATTPYVEAYVSYPNMATGDEITYVWSSTVVAAYEITVRVGDPDALPPDRTRRDFVPTNDGGYVAVSYRVKRGGLDPAWPSWNVRFAVSSNG